MQKKWRGDTEARKWPSRSTMWGDAHHRRLRFTGAGAGVAGQAFIAVNVDLVAVDAVRDNRRLFRIVANFLLRRVAHQ